MRTQCNEHGCSELLCGCSTYEIFKAGYNVCLDDLTESLEGFQHQDMKESLLKWIDLGNYPLKTSTEEL